MNARNSPPPPEQAPAAAASWIFAPCKLARRPLWTVVRAKCTAAPLLPCSDAADEAGVQQERREDMGKSQHFFGFFAGYNLQAAAGLQLWASMHVKIKDFGLSRPPNPKIFLASQGRTVTVQ